MIGRISANGLDAAQKAEMIYAQARSELAGRLWQAALGTGGDSQPPTDVTAPGFSMDSLIALLTSDAARAPASARTPVAETSWQVAGATPPPQAQTPTIAPSNSQPVSTGLGVNDRYQATLNAAAARTGLPATALAAIVHAESAKGADGGWLTYSRNPRSSAAGLGQFLSGTWVGETERKGSWLNGVAQERGWLDAAGKVRADARSELLALRYDGDASIQAIADYARSNLDKLERVGVDVGGSDDRVAKLAYLGHHLGLGDAIRFLKGGLSPARAELLLNAQVGRADAGRRIAESGDAASAHRAWFQEYMGRNLNPGRFRSDLPSA